jgi:hypothetical protein
VIVAIPAGRVRRNCHRDRYHNACWRVAASGTRLEESTMNEHDGGADEGRTFLSATTLRSMSVQDFARLGAEEVAYIRPVLMNGARAFSIHAADGTPIGAAPNAQLAAAAIRQHEMEPAAVH